MQIHLPTALMDRSRNYGLVTTNGKLRSSIQTGKLLRSALAIPRRTLDSGELITSMESFKQTERSIQQRTTAISRNKPSTFRPSARSQDLLRPKAIHTMRSTV